jgi:hypothetical protein
MDFCKVTNFKQFQEFFQPHDGVKCLKALEMLEMHFKREISNLSCFQADASFPDALTHIALMHTPVSQLVVAHQVIEKPAGNIVSGKGGERKHHDWQTLQAKVCKFVGVTRFMSLHMARSSVTTSKKEVSWCIRDCWLFNVNDEPFTGPDGESLWMNSIPSMQSLVAKIFPC